MFENIWKCHIFTYFQTFSNIFTHFHGKNETVHFYYYTSKNFFWEIATFGIRTIFHRSKKRVKIFENIWKFLKIIQTYRWTLSWSISHDLYSGECGILTTSPFPQKIIILFALILHTNLSVVVFLWTMPNTLVCWIHTDDVLFQTTLHWFGHVIVWVMWILCALR